MATGLGNTKSLRCKPSRVWCFTLNNYTEDHIALLEEKLETTFVFQQETGENGTPHLQGCVYFKKPVRPSESIKIKEIHWEKCRSWDLSVKYCSKTDTRTGKVFYKGVRLPRVDNRICGFIPNAWQQQLINIHESDPDWRKIYWYVDLKGGKGKSLLAKYMYTKYNDVCVVTATKSADILTSAEEHYKSYIIDMPRCAGEFCPFNAIEQIKNGFITDAKLKKKARVLCFEPPHVFVFSNHHPDLSKLSSDRWKIIEL